MIDVLTQTTTHATLLARLSSGQDPAAWAEFCDRYSELIRGFAHRHGFQPADCDEVVQDTLLALSRAMPGFRYDPERGRFRAYLKTVALHEIFRRTRQRSGVVNLENVECLADQTSDDPHFEQMWEAEWRQYHLRQAMRVIEMEFSEKDRAAFQDYALGGRDAADVAVSLQMSVDQVYQAKSRILKRLSEVIAQQVEEEG